MPFKKCHKCGSEFLAKTEEQVLCTPQCQGRRLGRVDVITSEAEKSSWGFAVVFIIACLATWYIYDNAYEVELFLIKEDIFRETMANKLAKSMPDSFPFVNDGLADPDIDVAVACLGGLNRNVDTIPAEGIETETFAALMKSIYEDPEEDPLLKKASIIALGLVKTPEIIGILQTAVHDSAYRDSAVLAMQKVPDPRFVNSLTAIIVDEMRQFVGQPVKYNAVIALSRIDEQDGDVMHGLLLAFRDVGSGSVRDEALTGIIRFCKRFKGLSISGKEEAKKGLRSLQKYCKSDTLYSIKERGKEEIPNLERIMKQ